MHKAGLKDATSLFGFTVILSWNLLPDLGSWILDSNPETHTQPRGEKTDGRIQVQGVRRDKRGTLQTEKMRCLRCREQL
jgi:hypothetical protein